MSVRTRIRLALGIVRSTDPGAWRCDLCRSWRRGPECFNHRMRVFGPPTTARPVPAPPPLPHMPTTKASAYWLVPVEDIEDGRYVPDDRP